MPEFVGSVNAGIAAGGGGVEIGGTEPGGAELGGAELGVVSVGGTELGVVTFGGTELGGGFRGCVVVVTTTLDDGVVTVEAVAVVEGVRPYAATGTDTDAATTATKTIRPRPDLNIGIPLGIRATDLQRSPKYPRLCPPVLRPFISFWALGSRGDPCRLGARREDPTHVRRGCSS